MNIIEAADRTDLLIQQLLEVWESSVKKTHLFLSAEEIAQIKQYVPQALKEIPYLLVVEDKKKQPIAFMGVAKHKLEMLFVAPSARGQGIGKELIKYGIAHYSINEVAVNEQNPLARGFYEHMGFRVYRRTAQDEQGKLYPLLYMKLL